MPQPEFFVDFPTLADLQDAWIEQHCRVPAGFARGKAFQQADWQFWCTANHYRIREDAEWNPDDPLLNQAFVHRRSQIIGPQKTGKGPWAAAITATEAVGPSLFGGWAEAGDTYRCSDNGCPCEWEFIYNAGEPMGVRHPSPLIQLTATSLEQVANIYRPLRAMIRMGPLKHLLLPRDDFIRILAGSDDPDEDRIDNVTSSARSRLGNPLTFAFQDETGLYTKSNGLREVAETQRRGAAGMGGRTIETTNMWDPSLESVAQSTFTSDADDIFRFYRNPDDVLRDSKGSPLKYTNKRDRRRIHKYVYEGSWWVNLDSIEAEAAELIEKDPAQAERFFGNREVAGLGTWLDGDTWMARSVKPVEVPDKTQIVLGFDGSDIDDWTGIRAETRDGYQFTPITAGGATIWNPEDFGGQVPRVMVADAVDELFKRYDVIRMYCDPPYWETEIDTWAEAHGEKRVIRWVTYRGNQMHAAAERLLTDVVKADSSFTHDGDEATEKHIRNTRKVQRPNARYYTLAKPGDANRKIDLAIISVLAHEAAGDATAAKLWRRKYRALSA